MIRVYIHTIWQFDWTELNRSCLSMVHMKPMVGWINILANGANRPILAWNFILANHFSFGIFSVSWLYKCGLRLIKIFLFLIHYSRSYKNYFCSASTLSMCFGYRFYKKCYFHLSVKKHTVVSDDNIGYLNEKPFTYKLMS